MKLVYGLVLAVSCIGIVAGKNQKHGNQKHEDQEHEMTCILQQDTGIPTAWRDMDRTCTGVLKAQVKKEIGAAVTYLAMGAHFANYKINRPGFSKLFFESASEEREHAIKILEYLLMRGEIVTDLEELLDFEKLEQTWKSGLDALKEALNLEITVTESIRKIIKVCEDPNTDKPITTRQTDKAFNDYHLTDYLITDFLDEQYKGQRDLAGKYSTLGKMMTVHGPLGEFLFDKKLLNGEL